MFRAVMNVSDSVAMTFATDLRSLFGNDLMLYLPDSVISEMKRAKMETAFVQPFFPGTSRPRDIQLVCAHLASVQDTTAQPDASLTNLIQNTDIDSLSLILGGFSNFRQVLVVTSPSQYSDVLKQLHQRGGPSLQFRFELMYAAIRCIGDHTSAIGNEVARWQVNQFVIERRPAHICE